MTPSDRAAAIIDEFDPPRAAMLERRIAQAIRAAIEAEREACAQVADVHADGEEWETAHVIAAAIRARGKP